MSDPISVVVTPPAPITVTVSGGVGPQGPAGAGGVTTLQGLSGALTLAAVGGTWSVAGSTITLTVTAAGSVAWADITGKPATFAPAAHTHAIADTTGLQAALDGKQAAGSYAAASHTHTASAVTDFSAAALLAVTWTTLTGKPAFAPVATSGLYSDLTGTPAAYSLPVATSSTLGGVKQGANVTIDGAGVISVAAPVSSLAWTAITGKPTFATVATTGAYSDLTGTPAAYSLPTASASTLGGIKIGSGLTIDGAGVVTAAGTYTLPAATVSTLGGVIVGTGLSVTSGTVAVAYGTSSTTACVGNDSRLSDARTPTAHNQAWSTITSTPTTLAGYGITDGLTSSSLASPPAIGGTTPAAGTFTVLAATSRANLPSGAAGSPAARDLYAVADTIRYRDSSNAERLLLNATDNLANLASAATARANLGLAAVASSGSASDLTSGTLAAARIGAHASTHQTGGADAVSPVVVTPTSLAADVNDWSIGTGDVFRVAGTAARNITGIAAGSSGLTILLVNVGSFALTLKHQSASSTTANRITVPWAGDCVLAASGGAAVLVYDSTSATWRVV